MRIHPTQKMVLFLATLVFVAFLTSCSDDVTQPPTPTDSEFNTADKAYQRSFDEWLAAQGTYCWPDDEGGCFLFMEPVPNYTLWYNPDTWHAICPDYAGVASNWLFEETAGAIDIGTVITGSVTERVQKDGTALLHIKMTSNNALIFGMNWETGDFLFGYSPQEVAYDGMTPVLGSVSLNIKLVMPEPGMPLPDLIEPSFFPEENMYVKFMNVRSKAEGPLREASGYPEGTWGREKVVQVNTAVPQPPNNPNWDGWPVEMVYIGL